MHQPQATLNSRFADEQGGASLNLLIVVLLIGAVVYAASQYAPVAYDAAGYKQKIEETVGKAAGLGYSTEWVKRELTASGTEYNVPSDAQINVEQRDGMLQATVQFTRPVTLPGYTYEYNFNYSAKSSTLSK